MAPVMRLERDAPPLRTATLQRLQRLAEALSQRGLDASLAAPPSRVPWLLVVHPAGGAAAEIYAGRSRDGTWRFWWPWDEPVASAEDLDIAADSVERELARPAGGPGQVDPDPCHSASPASRYRPASPCRAAAPRRRPLASPVPSRPCSSAARCRRCRRRKSLVRRLPAGRAGWLGPGWRCPGWIGRLGDRRPGR